MRLRAAEERGGTGDEPFTGAAEVLFECC